MSEVDQITPVADRAPDFKRMLLALKQKYAESAEQISELKATMSRAQKNSGYLEEENVSLQEQLLTLKNLLLQTKEGASQSKEEHSQLLEKLRATEDKCTTLEKENARITSLSQEKVQLQRNLDDNKRHTEQLERVIQFLREKAEGAHLETRQLRNDFFTSQETVTAQNQQVELLKSEAITKELECRAKLEIVSRVETEKQQLIQDKRVLENEIISLKATHHEQEMRIKIAQQHLAKKVKETTQMSEKLEEQKIQLIELQNAMVHIKAKNEELSQNMEQHLLQDRRMQEQVKEAAKSAEAQVSKWEEKYFVLCEKWQETESRNKDLRSFEEKYHQLQNSINNLSTLTSSSFGQHKPSPAVVEQVSRYAHQDLFDLKAMNSTKQNLFD